VKLYPDKQLLEVWKEVEHALGYSDTGIFAKSIDPEQAFHLTHIRKECRVY
jgi:hypothetical protein